MFNTPWEQSLYNKINNFDIQAIDLIYDIKNNINKSMFFEFLESEQIASIVPHSIMHWVCTHPICKCYIFDITGEIRKNKLTDISTIKDGTAYFMRNGTATKIRFDRPRIFVFTNILPINIPAHKWKIWTVNDDYELIEYKK